MLPQGERKTVWLWICQIALHSIRNTGCNELLIGRKLKACLLLAVGEESAFNKCACAQRLANDHQIVTDNVAVAVFLRRCLGNALHYGLCEAHAAAAVSIAALIEIDSRSLDRAIIWEGIHVNADGNGENIILHHRRARGHIVLL